MLETIGVAIIVKDEKKSIRRCIKSVADSVDQIVIVVQDDTSPKTLSEIKKASKKVEIYNFGKWVDDFSAKRNFSFSKLNTDWMLWIDADDEVYQPENLRMLIERATPQMGAIWFPYHYAIDEFGNVLTRYERERLLRTKYLWIWSGRLHETVAPVVKCEYARTDEVIIRHNHIGKSRNERNFGLLNIMYQENPDDKRVWLYFGHQNFASRNWLDASKWYMQFGIDKGCIPIERYQALCYAAKAMREMSDNQAVDTAFMAIELFPNLKDAYLELAQSYLLAGEYEKTLHWIYISDRKEIIVEPPNVIFVNPLDYTFNKFNMQTECYIRLGNFDKALECVKKAIEVRPVKELIETNLPHIQNMAEREKVDTSIKTLAVHLLKTKELAKLKQLPGITPFWYHELPAYEELSGGIMKYTDGIKETTPLIEQGNSVSVDIGNVYNLEALLNQLDQKYEKVKIECPMPTNESKQTIVYCQSDIEQIVMAKANRHIINLRRTPDKIICEYDLKEPQGIKVMMYVGPGLENWDLDTMKNQGCGGSETAAAYLARGFAREGCYPIVYAMDNQVWDGVVYRPHSQFKPGNAPCHLFISSRQPSVFRQTIPARQRWLWFHDVHRWQFFTPEIASQIDAFIVLSQWHAGFIKRTYPFMKDCEVIDFDNNKLLYNDDVIVEQWHTDKKAYKLPKMAIIGNGLDTERFENLTEERIPHRFLWCSSPDRGLEQVLEMWPLIKEKLPDAELKIFYGWEYFDSMLGIPAYRVFKEKIRKLVQQDGTEWCGRIGQEQLAKEMMKADIMLYPPPHEFRETYGITFLECQAAGTIVFYRQNGALGETIGNRGIPLANDMSKEDIVCKIVETIGNKELCGIIRDKGREYAMARTWHKQAQKCLSLYTQLNK